MSVTICLGGEYMEAIVSGTVLNINIYLIFLNIHT